MSDEMTKEQATAKIAELVKKSEKALEEATKLADEHGISFSIDGPAYGMGGFYEPREWASSGCEWESSDQGGWQSSSNNC